MEWENIFGQMAISTKGNLKMILNKEWEFFFGTMADNMKVYGVTTSRVE